MLKVPSEGNNQKTNSLECPFSFILGWYIRIVFYFCPSEAGQKSRNMTRVTGLVQRWQLCPCAVACSETFVVNYTQW